MGWLLLAAVRLQSSARSLVSTPHVIPSHTPLTPYDFFFSPLSFALSSLCLSPPRLLLYPFKPGLVLFRCRLSFLSHSLPLLCFVVDGLCLASFLAPQFRPFFLIPLPLFRLLLPPSIGPVVHHWLSLGFNWIAPGAHCILLLALRRRPSIPASCQSTTGGCTIFHLHFPRLITLPVPGNHRPFPASWLTSPRSTRSLASTTKTAQRYPHRRPRLPRQISSPTLPSPDIPVVVAAAKPSFWQPGYGLLAVDRLLVVCGDRTANHLAHILLAAISRESLSPPRPQWTRP